MCLSGPGAAGCQRLPQHWQTLAPSLHVQNAQDGHKQDALDLISGAYTVKRDVKLRFRPARSPALPLLGALALLGFAVQGIRLAASGGLGGGGGKGGAANGEEEGAHHTQLQVL